MKKQRATALIINKIKELIDEYNNGNIDYETLTNEVGLYQKIYSLPKKLVSQINAIGASSQVQNAAGISVSTGVISKIRSYINTHKKIAVTGATIVTLASAGSVAFNVYGYLNTDEQKNTTMSQEGNDDKAKEEIENALADEGNNDLADNLVYNPLDKELEITMMNEFTADSLKKGIEFHDETLESEVNELIDFKNVLNLDEFGVSDLAKKYQNDKITYQSMYYNYINTSVKLSMQTITAAKSNNDVLQLSKLAADKNDAEAIEKFSNLSGELADARKDGDKARISEIAEEYNQMINDIIINDSMKLSDATRLHLINMATFTREMLTYDHSLQEKMLPDATYDQIAGGAYCTEMNKALDAYANGTLEQGQTLWEKLAYQLLYTMEAKMNGMYSVLVDDNGDLKKFKNEISQETEVKEISKYLRDNNLLATFEANPSYEMLFFGVSTFEGTGATTTKRVVKKSNGVSVTVDEMASHGVDYDAEKAKGKTDDQIFAQYEQNVRNETDQKLASESGYKDMNGNKTTKENIDQAISDVDAYNAGVRASAGKTALITSAPSNYTGSAAKKYIEGYNYGVICNLDALKQNQTTYQSTDRQVVSSEENTTVSESIKDENLNKPATKEETTTSTKEQVTTPTVTPTQVPSSTATPVPTTINNPDGTSTSFVKIEEEIGTEYIIEESEEIVTYNSGESYEAQIVNSIDSIEDLKSLREYVQVAEQDEAEYSYQYVNVR